MREKLKENKGITLIALVITIIILIILAGISIGVLAGEKSPINEAIRAKEKAEIADETEALELAVIRAMRKDRYGNIGKENLDKELSGSLGKNNYTSKKIEEGVAVTFIKSNRSYLVESDGDVIQYIIREPVIEPEQSTTVAALETMLYGVIEVEFLGEKGYEISEANEPILKDGMEAVYWSKDASGVLDLENPANNTYEMTSDDANFKEENWYEYTAQIAANDGKTSRWANVIIDGSYYVWIPRYAYRIIYFDTPENEEAYRTGKLTEEEALDNDAIVGYSDARGIVDKDGKRPTSVVSTTSISVNDKYFRVHPVFDGNVDEGGWDSKLSGIWVMKYEASRNDATATKGGTGTIPKSVPHVKSAGGKVSEAFNYAKNVHTELNSHMMKNSEWGSIVYLAESKYGRNGTEISMNQCSGVITGTGRGSGDNAIYNLTYAWNEITDEQKYNGKIGQLSSTTGNIYGIYDISGGKYEHVMGFYQDANKNIYTGTSTTQNSGFNGFVSADTEITDGIEFPTEKKYYQLYQKTNTDGKDLGDALYETKGWNDDSAGFIVLTYPVFIRGGELESLQKAGAYSYSNFNGTNSWKGGWRVCFAIK